MKTFEIEITRNNVTPAEFLHYVRNRVDAKGGAMFRGDLDTAYFAAGNDLNFDIRRTAEEAAETTNGCIRELSVSRPYEMQTFCAWIDGTKYNEICEFSFDDEKTGHGYYYLINVYADDDAQPAQDAENETETENQTDAENAADGAQEDENTMNETRNALEVIAEAYDEMQRGEYADGNSNLHACIWYHMPRPSGIVYSRTERLQIVKLAQEYNDEPHTTTAAALRAVCDALEILHGIAFDWHEIRGCCQGEWQYMICPDEYGIECRDEIETEYFNAGDEWKIDGNGDTFTVYTHSWRDDEKRQEIADAVGCDPSDVILYAFDGYEYTPKYKEVS